jgi:hypothetical protein
MYFSSNILFIAYRTEEKHKMNMMICNIYDGVLRVSGRYLILYIVVFKNISNTKNTTTKM